MHPHPKQVILEQTFKKMFDEIDDIMEERYGELWPLHPNRLSRGLTANKESDGLFNVGVSFSAGFGSKFGRGYVVDLRVSTLNFLPAEKREELYSEVAKLIEERLPIFFPTRELKIVRDENIYKIVGDFSLGTV